MTSGSSFFRSSFLARTGLVLISLALVFGLTGCELPEIIQAPAPVVTHNDFTYKPQVETEGEEKAQEEQEQDYYRVLGDAQVLYTVTTPGMVEYCPLDGLGRAGCAYGELTTKQRKAAKARGRQDITADPAGWPKGANQEVTIPALAHVAGSKNYNGWFWNRSHLVADSLGGNAESHNLVTGTRTQNVGSAQKVGQYAGGMAYTEILARVYLDDGHGDACPLYYAATPVYTGDELVPRSVVVDVLSCDRTINSRVEVFNTANGWNIDYATAQYSRQ